MHNDYDFYCSFFFFSQEKLGNQVPWKNSNEEEISLWDEAFEKPCTEVTASLSLRPRIKLTYK